MVVVAGFVRGVVVGGESPGAFCLEGVFTNEQVKRGGAVSYEEVGQPWRGAPRGGAPARPGGGGGPMPKWDHLTGGALFDRVRSTMPLDSPGRLSRQQNADVIAFILKTNAWPSGSLTALPPDSGALKQIQIETARR